VVRTNESDFYWTSRKCYAEVYTYSLFEIKKYCYDEVLMRVTVYVLKTLFDIFQLQPIFYLTLISNVL
jgi:hypothetical protein